MKPAWLDRAIAAAERHRVPWLAVVAVLWVLQVLVVNGAQWVGGDLAFPHLDRKDTLDVFYGPYAIGGYALLRFVAGRAFDRYLPALDIGPKEASRMRERLITMPARTALVGTLVGAVVGVLVVVADPTMTEGGWDLGVVVVVLVNSVFNLALSALLLAQLFRLLRHVVRLHRAAVNIDLFDPDPAHALATLTAVGGVVLVAEVSYSVATDPSTFTNPALIGVSAAFSMMSVAMFFLPLSGMRRRLAGIKEAQLTASAARISRVAAAIDAAVDDDRYEDVSVLKTARDALVVERERITKASAWPWSGSTLRRFASAIGLPLVTWLITGILGKVLDL